MSFLQFTDQLNRKIEIPFPPQRIISLVPSQTELLADLKLDNEVVGITKFCLHPDAWYSNKIKVGGTKKLNFEIIRQLQPDLIIGNKEENEQKQIEALMGQYPVWLSNVKTLNDALEMIFKTGLLTNRKSESEKIAGQIKLSFSQVKPVQRTINAAYLIWKKPIMTINRDTFIHDMMQHCGMKNIFARHEKRYPEIHPDALAAANPEIILLSSEPFPFSKKHIMEFESLCPNSKVMLVDGAMFSWYGSRLLKSVGYFEKFTKLLQQ